MFKRTALLFASLALLVLDAGRSYADDSISLDTACGKLLSSDVYPVLTEFTGEIDCKTINADIANHLVAVLQRPELRDRVLAARNAASYRPRRGTRSASMLPNGVIRMTRVPGRAAAAAST